MNETRWQEAKTALRIEITTLAPEMVKKIQELYTRYGSSAKAEPDGWIAHLMDEQWQNLSAEDRERAESANLGYEYYRSLGHFGWGMGCRNWLREFGFGEVEMGFDNWDDHYARLVEEALELK